MILHPGGYLSPDKLEVPTCLLPSMNENEEKVSSIARACARQADMGADERLP